MEITNEVIKLAIEKGHDILGLLIEESKTMIVKIKEQNEHLKTQNALLMGILIEVAAIILQKAL
jgi:hypothetical protein